MPLYRNAHHEARVWPSVRRADGRTLALAPGEVAETAETVEDPFLEPVSKPGVVKPAKSVEED